MLGGMGPAATADFLARLARLTPATRDQDHVATLVYSDPSTPDRSDALVGRGPSPLPAMIRGVEFLSRAGCALIAIPCNTAHHWYDELAERSAVPVLHIVEAAVHRLRGYPDVRTVGLLSTDGTVRAGIYHDPLRRRGVTVLDLSDRGEASPVMRGIRALKAGKRDDARRELCAAGHQLAERGAQLLLVACTDVSAALPDVDSIAGRPLLDAADCLALASLDRLRSHHRPGRSEARDAPAHPPARR
ncbi:MAG: amino acid racemase [Micromonosporaceae bacterium]